MSGRDTSAAQAALKRKREAEAIARTELIEAARQRWAAVAEALDAVPLLAPVPSGTMADPERTLRTMGDVIRASAPATRGDVSLKVEYAEAIARAVTSRPA